jgi:aspartyl-tRNA(Asn)/glutamyl-tRNA(Gln) amidotransferase subunit B
MEEGSMRVDANVSVNRPGDEFGTRCEIKNLNSLRSLGRAIDYEARRQVDLLESGERIQQQTRHWDEAEGRTHTLRSKEEADDYRYFAEPDLVPLRPTAETIAEIDAAIPALPADRRVALVEATGTDGPTAAIVVERDLDALTLATIGEGAPVDRVLTHVEHNLSDAAARDLDPARFARLVTMETGGELTATQAKQVLAEMVETGGDPAEIAAARGFEAMDTGALETLVDEAIAADPAAWEKFVGGDDKVAGAFVGYAMKATKGQADGKAFTALLRERRSAGA